MSGGVVRSGSDCKSWKRADFINLLAQYSKGSILISRYIGMIHSFFTSLEERIFFIREVFPVCGSPIMAIFCLYPSEKELIRWMRVFSMPGLVFVIVI
ncbi:MAG: hypothetical protein QGI05_01660 [Candidatus Omnitrophota bacterium]|nr:hypothetical protein [Candidatus Omnitrophota bacterium]